MKPLDKKQIPQVIGLAVLALAFLGYFVVKLILPTPAAAGTQATQTVATAAAPPAPGAAPSAAQTPADAQALSAPPPSPDLRDPFVPAISDKPAPAPPPAPPVRTASLKGPEAHGSAGIIPLPFNTVPVVPALPSAHGSQAALRGPASLPGSLAPLAVAPPVPAWTVTGVLQSGSEHVAILRNGDARRFVKQGDSLDGEFRVVLVTRQTVVLGHGTARFVLPLGGAKVGGTTGATNTIAPAAFKAHSGLPPSDPKLLPPGSIAPDFTLAASDGHSVSLSSFRGRTVIIDFWASWCPPCQRSMPHIQNIYQDLGGSGLAVLSVNTGDEKSSMLNFLSSHREYTTTMLFDSKLDNVAAGKYQVTGIPTVYVIDKNGRVAAAYVCPTEQMLREALAALGVSKSGLNLARLSNQVVIPHIAAAPRVVQSHFALVRLPALNFRIAAAQPAVRKPVVVAKTVHRVAARIACKTPKVRVAAYLSGNDTPGVSPRGMLALGTPAPDFSLSTLNGRTVALSQFAGKPVILDFWASWDAQSVRMLSSLAQVQRDLGDAVTVVSVNTWDNQESLRAFAAGHSVPGISLFDPSVSNESVAVGLYKAPDVPTCYVLDAEGRVAAAFVGHGRNTTGALEAALAKLGAR